MHILRLTAAASALLISAAILLQPICQSQTPAQARGQSTLLPPDSKNGINRLSWLAGRWKSKKENLHSFEEHWMTPHDGCMVGMGRETNGSKTAFFEFLRIEERKDGIFYVAQPRGNAKTDFKLTKETGSTFRFENPQHDFPKAIEYEKRADGSLVVRVLGDNTREKSFEHTLHKF